MEVVPFFTFGVAGIFAGKHLGSLTVIGVVAGALGQEPVVRPVEVFVHQVCLQAFHLRPQVIELLAFRVRAAGTHNLDFRVRGTNGLQERLQVLRVGGVPLLVANADKLHVERFRVPHFCADLAPRGIHGAIGKFNQVQGILDEGLELVQRAVGFGVLVLELAGEAAAQDGERLRANFFAELEELKEAQAVALVIVGVEAVGEGVFPAVLVEGTVFHRAHGVFPVVAGLQVRAFHNAAAGEAENARAEVVQGLGQVFAKTVLMAHPGIYREQGNMLQVCGSTLSHQENAEDALIQRLVRVKDELVFLPVFSAHLEGVLAKEVIFAHGGGVG